MQGKGRRRLAKEKQQSCLIIESEQLQGLDL